MKPYQANKSEASCSNMALADMTAGMITCWSDNDQSFIIEVTEVLGCMADGQTYQEAVANAGIIIQDWIETAKSLGRPIPEPKGKQMYAGNA